MWTVGLTPVRATSLQAWAVQWCFASREHFKHWHNFPSIWYKWFAYNYRQPVLSCGSTKGMH